MGTGGRRWGAGRPAHHVKAEQCRRIDARRWAREGSLREGRSGWWQWTDAHIGETVATISYWTEAHTVSLTYRLSGESMQQRVQIYGPGATTAA